jgi:uracil-DNA glycosylase
LNTTNYRIKGWPEPFFPYERAEQLIQRYTSESETKKLFPAKESLLNAFEICSLEQVKVVLIGQDPYHQAGQAHGLSFSVPFGVKIPPSLRNIFKELQNDLECEIDIQHGNLSSWAKQGVLLLNSSLSVEESKPGSHRHWGWESFTDLIIRTLSEEKNHLVFLLWGNHAKKKSVFIHPSRHLILHAAHPSPLSYFRGFEGCKHFSKTNHYLQQNGQTPIQWDNLDFP